MSPPRSALPASFTERAILCNLIRQEWYLSRGPVVLLAMIWLIGLWILVIFDHPAYLIAIGLCHVILVSPSQAGRDIIDGTEEFSFTLPPGRSPIYLARCAPGLAFLLVNGLLGSLTIAYSLPQRLWSLCFSGGLTDPFAPVSAIHWYGMAVLLPCAAHAVTVALAANARSRAVVNYSGMLGIAAAGSLMVFGFFLEDPLWQKPNGFIAGPMLFAMTVLVLRGGQHFYCGKEATGSGGAVGGVRRAGVLWFIAMLMGLLVCLAAFFWLWRSVAVRSSAEMERTLIRQENSVRQLQLRQQQIHSVPTPPVQPERERDNH